ncbi:TonB-dependent receptor [Mucilaginibacter sp. Bleaf8]|uniref:TonB-dependent receptor n=1 Tax=Mucilaginibacter sp. Bleaf8 TaxID=2834430 RepID=UPI001BCCD188|nr:TonB-dependent receptor [Mucilaginibacter sp. Bleaf8]MBS7563687.1 TonB-dependent receptor [Mucilaginibacter sp. Bleaf8]
MVKFLLFFLLTFCSCRLFAQVPAAVKAPNSAKAVALRDVSGMVKDTANNAVIGATVKVKAGTDSVSTTTNADGAFTLKNVKSATFIISVSSIGYQTVVRRMLNNDAVQRLQLDPIILRTQANVLHEVIVNGTPSISYKTDTVEYKASDYKVRPNATVDEVLKKMEGMEVASDGSVTHQGQKITKVKLNGKEYAGGDLAKAIQNLPADIIDKIQVVDDYGDQAARTGIKDGDPQKVINITTRADRSVGNIARLSAGAGNDKRYEGRVFLQRLNGNEQIALIGNYRNTVNGVASSGNSGGGNGGGNGGGGGSGGTTTSGGPSINYRNQWGKKVQINGNYNLSYRNVNSLNNSNGQQFFSDSAGNRINGQTISFINNSANRNTSKTHNFNFEFEYTPDTANYLKIVPNFSYTGSSNTGDSRRFETGLRHQDTHTQNSSDNTAPNWGGLVFYQHIFKKPKRNASVQLSYNSANQSNVNDRQTAIRYYQDSTDLVRKDSLVHNYIKRTTLNKNFRASATYVEPLTPVSQLEFNGQMNYRAYDNRAITDNIDSLGTRARVDSLSNIFNYSFTEVRLALNYRLNKPKYNISVGVTAVPTVLDGSRSSISSVSVHQNNFNLIPIARFQYIWSREERFSVNYSGSPSEPSFNQIQPVRDVSSPQNPVVGNPNLKPSFRHSINAQYNNYLVNSHLNISGAINTSITSKQIVTNNVRIADVFNSFKTETRFLNLNGSYGVNGYYNISKQLADRKYNLSLNGSASYNRGVSMTDNIKSFTTSWHLNERLGPRINPNESIEVNPFVSYDVARTFFGLSNTSTDVRTTALAIDGRFFFMKNRSLTIGYDASKNYVKGISSNLTRNPLVINAYIEKDFFKKRLLTVNLQVFDILKQNNFVSQTTTENSYTNTLSNALSRYFMLSVRSYLQKWTGSPRKNGHNLRRRGDGSFIEP